MECPTIRKGERVRLVPLTEEDVDWLWRTVNRREIWIWMGRYGVLSLEDERQFVQRALSDKDRPHLLILNEKGERVGVVGVNEYDRYNGRAEVGYWISPEHQGKGYATEALELFLDLLFRELNYRKVYAPTFASNEASWRVLEKTGFKREGRLRKHSYNPATGRYDDDLVYGLLRREWERMRE